MPSNHPLKWNLSPSETGIGWVGTGVMGLSMCGHLMSQGYAVTVFNRTKAKAQPLLDRGALWADSPQAVAERKEWIKANWHLRGKAFFRRLNARLQGHYSYYGVRGNSNALYRYPRAADRFALRARDG